MRYLTDCFENGDELRERTCLNRQSLEVLVETYGFEQHVLLLFDEKFFFLVGQVSHGFKALQLILESVNASRYIETTSVSKMKNGARTHRRISS